MSTTRGPERREWLRAFGEAVRQIRLREGLSQEQLGFRSGLDRTYVSGIERGNRNPTMWVLFRLARGLGKSPSAILEAAEDLSKAK